MVYLYDMHAFLPDRYETNPQSRILRSYQPNKVDEEQLNVKREGLSLFGRTHFGFDGDSIMALLLTILGFNPAGDGLINVMDPWLRWKGEME